MHQSKTAALAWNSLFLSHALIYLQPSDHSSHLLSLYLCLSCSGFSRFFVSSLCWCGKSRHAQECRERGMGEERHMWLWAALLLTGGRGYLGSRFSHRATLTLDPWSLLTFKWLIHFSSWELQQLVSYSAKNSFKHYRLKVQNVTTLVM